MNTPRKHAELIKAWADGAEIERLDATGEWVDAETPSWNCFLEYRIKPESKKTVKRWQWVVRSNDGDYFEHDKFGTEAEMTDHAERHGYTIIKRLDYTELECDE